MKKYLLLQSIVLALGTIFAFYTVYEDFQRYINPLFDVIHPALTPCFYGAFAFLIAFVWSLLIYKNPSINQQKYLLYLIIFGVVFAFANVGVLVYKYLKADGGEFIGCSGVPTTNPFATACFYGAILFFLSAVVAYLAYWNTKKSFSI